MMRGTQQCLASVVSESILSLLAQAVDVHHFAVASPMMAATSQVTSAIGDALELVFPALQVEAHASSVAVVVQ